MRFLLNGMSGFSPEDVRKAYEKRLEMCASSSASFYNAQTEESSIKNVPRSYMLDTSGYSVNWKSVMALQPDPAMREPLAAEMRLARQS